MSNRLAHETSPYLLQHADNPVDWYPWGEEALQKARAEDKPIFVSIGYSACHWCHVMAHESFEDEQVAEILNEHFVNVKVDREERPDLDRIYMSAVQAMTGSGGWPMSVFLMPDGQPFYGGTYFPPTRRYQMPSFTEVLQAVIDAWQNRRSEITNGSQRVTQAIKSQTKAATPDETTLESAFQTLWQNFEHVHGGWGNGPKFPQPMILEFLLRYHHTTGDARALEMVTQTLHAMAQGGMYDQLGGGFHRYSVDERWLVPHFEKMLYDNAQLARVYLHAWQVTGDPFYRTITQEVLDYVIREMTDPAGGFYATQDADSEGKEGKFFVWEAEEIRELLGPQADRFMAAYGVTPAGNFEGQNILELVDPDRRAELAQARQKLFAAREKRVHPGRDEKVLTSWNGLMLAAFAEAARALDGERAQVYCRVAERNAEFLWRELRRPEGRLWHTWKANPENPAGGTAKINGYLEDYAHLMAGLLELYQTTFDARWYQRARELAETVISHFADPDGGFFDTSDDHEQLIVRPKELQDNAVPSGNGMATVVLLRLAELAVEPAYVERVERSQRQVGALLGRYPLGFGQWLIGLDDALSAFCAIAIVGDPEAADTKTLLAASTEGYRPHQVLAVGKEAAGVPLLQGRDQVADRATAYVCVDWTCRAPVTQAEALAELME